MFDIQEYKKNTNLDKCYLNMLDNINKKLPAINKDGKNFHKSHSQFMNVTVDVNDISPIRSLSHILAVIEKTKIALQEGTITVQKRTIKLNHCIEKLAKEKCNYKKDLLVVRIRSLETKIENQKNYLNGAVRKINFFINQYNNVLEKNNLKNITEEMFEKAELRHHIMTVFKQALLVCRSKGGVIDEGNQIYFFDLGINGLMAQAEINMYLNYEQQVIKDGGIPTHEMQMKWLESCADKYEKLDYESLNHGTSTVS
jgi:hypothetical protein